MRQFMQGQFAEARSRLESLIAEAHEARDPIGLFMLQLRLALVNSEVDSAERARELMRAGVERHPQMKFFQAGLAKVHVDAGDLELAREEFERLALGGFEDIPHNETYGLTAALLADVAANLSDAERARTLYDALRPAEGRFIVIFFAAAVFGSADRLLGRLAQTFGDLERELSRAFGLSGRSRVAGSTAERARVSVTRAIRKAVAEIQRLHPALGEHLERAIRTGRMCSDQPVRESIPDWRL